jgi:hypothetical protein
VVRLAKQHRSRNLILSLIDGGDHRNMQSLSLAGAEEITEYGSWRRWLAIRQA